MHPVGSYCMDVSQCTVNKTLNLNIITSLSFTEIHWLWEQKSENNCNNDWYSGFFDTFRVTDVCKSAYHLFHYTLIPLHTCCQPVSSYTGIISHNCINKMNMIRAGIFHSATFSRVALRSNQSTASMDWKHFRWG